MLFGDAFIGTTYASAASSSPCVGASAATYRHTFDGSAGTATITSTAPLCDGERQAFTLVSYTAPAKSFGNPQFVYATHTATVTASKPSVTLRVDVPGCYTQVDTIFGTGVINPIVDGIGADVDAVFALGAADRARRAGWDGRRRGRGQAGHGAGQHVQDRDGCLDRAPVVRQRVAGGLCFAVRFRFAAGVGVGVGVGVCSSSPSVSPSASESAPPPSTSSASPSTSDSPVASTSPSGSVSPSATVSPSASAPQTNSPVETVMEIAPDDGNGAVMSSTIDVSPTESGSLPVTGANTTVLGGTALFMIAFGGGLILLSRRPRHGRHSA